MTPCTYINHPENVLENFASSPLWQALLPVSESFNVSIYPVGGCIRDALINPWPADGFFDDLDWVVINQQTTSSPSAKILAKEISARYNGSLVPLDPTFGIYRVVLHPGLGLPSGEILPKRLYLDFSDALENSLPVDLARRDLSINAMALDLYQKQFLDPFCGLADLASGTIRMVSATNLQDDPLRMLRVFRFAAKLQARHDTIHYDPQTLSEIKQRHTAILSVAPERIQEELYKLFSARHSFNALNTMGESGLLETIFPELSPMRSIPPNGHHHLGLFEHTLELVRQAERFFTLLPEPEQAYLLQPFANTNLSHFGMVKWACLAHDLGKPDTMEIKETANGERFTFYGHDQVSADYSAQICKRLKTGNAVKERLMLLTRWHLYPCQFGRQSARKSVLRFYRRLGEATPDLILLALADRHSTLGPDVTQTILDRETDQLFWLLENYHAELDTLKMPRLLDGNELMSLLSTKPGPHLKDILLALEEAQQLGEVLDKTQAQDWVLKHYGT